MADARVTGFRYTYGTRLALGTIIDGYLEPEDVEALYAVWEKNRGKWPDPLEFSGKTLAITCEMLLNIVNGKEADSKTAFEAAFTNKKQAKRIWNIAAANAER